MMTNKSLTSRVTARQMAVRPTRCLRVFAQKQATPAPVEPEKKPYEDNSGFKFGFSKDNELQVGRAAMLGFASSLLGEILTGKGALAQFGYELEINNLQQDELLVLAIVVIPPILSVILPKSQRFVPETDLDGRTPGSLQNPLINLTEPAKFFGTTEFGWSKQNELFVGRVAQLGFAASIIGEAFTGKGPLAQFDFETGIPLIDTEAGLVAFIAFFVFAAIGKGSGRFVEIDSAEGSVDEA